MRELIGRLKNVSSFYITKIRYNLSKNKKKAAPYQKPEAVNHQITHETAESSAVSFAAVAVVSDGILRHDALENSGSDGGEPIKDITTAEASASCGAASRVKADKRDKD